MDKLEPLRIVAINGAFFDPSVDADASQLDFYRVERDRKYLVFKEGMAPVEFILKPLTGRHVALLHDLSPNEIERYHHAFRASCHRIERGGKVLLEVPEADLKEWRHNARRAPDAWLDQVAEFRPDPDGRGFGWRTIEEMGQVAYSMTRIAPGDRGPFVFRAV